MGPQSRLRVARSPACSLAINRAPEEEIAAAIDDTLREDLPIAIQSVRNDLAPAGPLEIAAKIGAIVGLIGMEWSQHTRDEFTDLALKQFLTLPGALVLDALERAQRRVNSGRILVSWVFDDVEPKADRLKLECQRLERLAELAG